MSSLSIKNWQSGLDDCTTRMTMTSRNCSACKRGSKNTEPVVVCTCPGHILDIFCWKCWSKQEWVCTCCNTVPADDETVACDTCGQWTHIPCEDPSADIGKEYACKKCKSKDESVILKSKLFDLQEDKKKIQERQDAEVSSLETDVQNLEQSNNALTGYISSLENLNTRWKDANVVLEVSLEQHKTSLAKSEEKKNEMTLKVNRMTSLMKKEVEKAENDLHVFYADKHAQYVKSTHKDKVLICQQLDELKKKNSDLKEAAKKVDYERNRFRTSTKQKLKRAREEHMDLERIYNSVRKKHIVWQTKYPHVLTEKQRELWSKHDCARRTVYGETYYTVRGTKYQTTSLPNFLNHIENATKKN